MTYDIELARKNMVENQVRTWDVLDFRILDTLQDVPREDFVPQAYRNLAFTDMSIPLAHGESMMKPVVEGRILQALNLDKSDQVLEIGTGSGYFTACMARMAKQVTSIDIHPDFIEQAGQTLDAAGCSNVSLVVSDAMQTFAPSDRFDVVVVTGGVPTINERFLQWVKPYGRAFMVYGHSPVMRASLFHRQGSDAFTEESLFETDLQWLQHAAPAPAFTF